MATLIYGFTSLNVADGNSLKEIDGALLNDGDMALGIYNSMKCFYQLDESSGATESLPDIVSPSLNAGTKRWILKAYLVADITANGLTASKAVFTDANKKLISIGTLGVDQGGTGASTLTDHGVLLGSGTDPITALGVMTNGQLVIGSTGADPVVASITDGEGIDTTAGAGTLTIACEDASESNKGVTVYAGNAKALAGTDTASAMTPADVKTVVVRVLMTGQVTITNANTGQPHWLMTTALTANVSLPYSLPNANYTVLVEVEDADDKDRVGEIKISSKAINGFTITVTGNTNNIDLRWTVVDPNFWTR